MNKQLTVQHLIHAKVINFVISQKKDEKETEVQQQGFTFQRTF